MYLESIRDENGRDHLKSFDINKIDVDVKISRKTDQTTIPIKNAIVRLNKLSALEIDFYTKSSPNDMNERKCKKTDPHTTMKYDSTNDKRNGIYQ